MKKSYHSVCRWTFNPGKGGFVPADMREEWSSDDLTTAGVVRLIKKHIKPKMPDHVELGYEVHYNNEINEKNAPEVADALIDAGMSLAMITPGAHIHFGYGGVASLDDAERKEADELGLKTVDLAYVDQSRDTLEGEKTVWEEISGGQDEITLGGRRRNTRAYVASFNFLGSDQQKRVKDLSGGERNRVHLAKILKQGANVILLDEPTNDLDVNTLRSLEEALDSFAGCAMVISHDRWFLDRIATHILAFEGDSQLFWFEGNWSDYEDDRRRRLGVAADVPQKVKYRSLTRD